MAIKKYFSLPVFILVFIAITLRLYKSRETFFFNHDQEIPANLAYEFFKFGKISLIGQELSFQGFFLGPLHNFIALIPYGLCGLWPDCVPYFYLVVSTLIILAIFLVFSKIFGKKFAFVSTLIFAISYANISYERLANSNFFIIISFVVLLYCIWKYFEGKDSFLVLGGFFAGLAVVNFNPVFLFSSLAFFTTALFRKNKNVIIFVFSAIAFLINWTPLFVFNMRHGGLIVNSLKTFSNQNVGGIIDFDRFVNHVFHIQIPFYTNFLFLENSKLLFFVTTCLIIVGFIYLIKERQKPLYFVPLTILFTLIGFSLYRGHVPDYYFLQTIVAFVILLTFAIHKKIYLYLFFVMFIFYNLSAAINFSTNSNYQFKKKVINAIIEDSKGESFNVYFDMPKGMNVGYNYIFKASNRLPQEGAKNLYFVEVNDNFNIDKFYKAFSNKTINEQLIGFVHLISIK